ncbi:MAG: tetratricopeptide repeat protein [Flavobacteriales bacterium]|nr:tetratricopeptide repeat protein [Flavobacteriales bacterium]
MKTPALALTLWATTALAQNANVVNAYNYMQDGDLGKAAEYIEPAIANETTMGKEKTWRYRGDIYRLIALGDKAELKAKYPDAMQRAIESYLRAVELDVKGSYRTENIRALGGLQGASVNAGNEAFTAQQFDQAVGYYQQSQRIAKAFNQVDTLALFNMALAYDSKGDAAKAIESYKECLAVGYTKPEVYRYLSLQYKKSGDMESAIRTLAEGRTKYPQSKEMIQEQLGLLLETGRSEEAEKVVAEAIAADPNNALFHFVQGNLFDGKASPKEGTAPSEADANTWYDKAEASYKRCTELDPTFFDAWFNLGAIYNNRAATCYEKANTIKDNEKYNKAKKECDDIYLKAVPFFEKAHELQPEDVATIQQLMKLYAKTNDQARYDALKAKLPK